VHLVGSWDGYKGQLPLALATGKKDAWAGRFRFHQGTIRDSERYWYYYIIDGYHVAHDPACDSTVEPKTGRRLNLLVVRDGVAVKQAKSGPGAVLTTTKTTSSADTAAVKKHSTSASTSVARQQQQQQKTIAARRHGRRGSVDVPRGRPVSPSQIRQPQPMKPPGVASPRAASAVSEAQVSEHGSATVAHLAKQLDKVSIDAAGVRAHSPDGGVDWDAWSSSDVAVSSGSECESEECESDSENESDVASAAGGRAGSWVSAASSSSSTAASYNSSSRASAASSCSSSASSISSSPEPHMVMYERRGAAAMATAAADESDLCFDSD
jgi:hypothetical protein